MKKCHWTYTVMSLSIFLAGSVFGAEKGALFPCFLVDAEVLSITNDGRMVHSELRVTTVLYGPETLSNRTFHAAANSSGQGGVGALVIYPPLEKGEQGIWPIRLNNDGTLVVEREALVGESLVDLPCRWKREKTRCEEVLSLVKTLKAVSEASIPKRQEMIESLATNDNALVRRWAEYAGRRMIEGKSSKGDQK